MDNINDMPTILDLMQEEDADSVSYWMAWCQTYREKAMEMQSAYIFAKAVIEEWKNVYHKAQGIIDKYEEIVDKYNQEIQLPGSNVDRFVLEKDLPKVE